MRYQPSVTDDIPDSAVTIFRQLHGLDVVVPIEQNLKKCFAGTGLTSSEEYVHEPNDNEQICSSKGNLLFVGCER